MRDVQLQLLGYVFGQLSVFVVFAMTVRWLYSRLAGTEYGVFAPREAVLERYSDFGGYGPAVAGAAVAVLVGVVVESLLLLLSALLVVSVEPFGLEELLASSALGALTGVTLAYWLYLETETRIRESPLYRGWE